MKPLYERLPSLSRIATEKCRRHLSEYTKNVWPILEPATPFSSNWHIDYITEHLEAIKAGQITRLLVNIPPRYMKSTLITVHFPTWMWIEDPSSRWVFSSYSASLSTKHSVDRRAIIQSPWYQERWADKFQLSTDQNVKTEYTNDKRGHMISTSTGGSATGKGGNFIIVDDPVNPKEAMSKTMRDEANTFFNQSLYNRLDDKKKGVIIIVMQRLHEKDLTGHVLADNSSWVHLKIPAIATKKHSVFFPISGKELVREENTLIWPEREDWEQIDEQKKRLGSYGFSGQYQQDPSPEEGGILKRKWWQYYKEAPAMDMFDSVLISMDSSYKNNTDNDWVVIQVWGRIGARKYLLYQYRAKQNFPEAVNALKKAVKDWPWAKMKLIEGKANGPAIIQTLKDSIAGLVEVDPQGGKVARAHAISPTLEAGDVYIPHPDMYSWVDDYIEEHAKFPNAEYDDQVDCTTQALMKLDSEPFSAWGVQVDWL